MWANLHGLFAVGLAVIALVLAGEWIDGRLRRPGAAPRARLTRLAGVGAVAALACLVNPNGLELFLYPVRQLLALGGGAGQRAAEIVPSVELMPLSSAWRTVHPPVLAAFAALALGAFNGHVARALGRAGARRARVRGLRG